MALKWPTHCRDWKHLHNPQRTDFSHISLCFIIPPFQWWKYVKAHLWNIVVKVAEQMCTPKAEPHLENVKGSVDCYEQPVWKHKHHNARRKAISPTTRKTSWNVWHHQLTLLSSSVAIKGLTGLWIHFKVSSHWKKKKKKIWKGKADPGQVLQWPR